MGAHPASAAARRMATASSISRGSGANAATIGRIWLGWMLHIRVKPNSRAARRAARAATAVSVNSVTTLCDGTFANAWQAAAISSLARTTSGCANWPSALIAVAGIAPRWAETKSIRPKETDSIRGCAAIAAHPRIESVSFGLMDFVSAHRGAIPATAMSAEGQFAHPLVVRAKLEIAAACHAFAKVPSHSVVTEFTDTAVVARAARRAAREFGFTRMWSIHPSQIRPIVAAFAPVPREVDEAVAILLAAADAGWAPIRHGDALHDRASYRYWWRIVSRARRTGVVLPPDFERRLFAASAAPERAPGRVA